MPSPFPGMDPWLEAPAFWHPFHTLFISAITVQLNARLPEDLVAFPEERVFVVEQGHSFIPDVSMFMKTKLSSKTSKVVATRASADKPKVLDIFSETMRERFVEIRATRPDNKVITVLEVLSPSNKRRGSAGRVEYLRKQYDILDSDVNLVEVDLLRQGMHTVAIPLEPLSDEPLDYLISLHRCSKKERFEYWPLLLKERLPRISIPLQENREDVVLDLQSALDTTYEGGSYGRVLNYENNPEPPLSAQDSEWADALLRAKGLRA